MLTRPSCRRPQPLGLTLRVLRTSETLQRGGLRPASRDAPWLSPCPPARPLPAALLLSLSLAV